MRFSDAQERDTGGNKKGGQERPLGMRQKKKIRWWHVLVGLIAFVFFLILGTCTAGVLSPVPYLYLDSFSGKVVDTDTKEPVVGAVVLAVYFKETYSVAGSNSWTVDGQEVLTDENGEFNILSKRRWFALHRGYTEGNLTIFKPGYGVFPGHKLSRAVGENKTWPPSEKYIVFELPKLKTREERKNNMYFDHYLEIPYKKRKNFLKLINDERKYLGGTPYSIPDGEK